MNDLSVVEPPFSLEILKSAIRATKSDLVRQDEYDLDQYFIAAKEIRNKFDDDITAKKVAMDEHNEIENAELITLVNQLEKIQQTLFKNLPIIIGSSVSGAQPQYTSVVAETPQYYFISDKNNVIKESLQSVCKITKTTKYAHQTVAKKRLERIGIKSSKKQNPIWVVIKPPIWWQGQRAVSQRFVGLIQMGLSPTEAVDYWMVTVMGYPVAQWAAIRGKAKSTIYSRIKTAEKKIKDRESSVGSKTALNNLDRNYTCETTEDGSKYYTVDNTALHPRRDIAAASTTGKLSSGYKGAGPKQLAIALLADLRNSNHTHQFIRSLNDRDIENLATQLHGTVEKIAKINEDGSWTLSEDELKRWVLEQKS